MKIDKDVYVPMRDGVSLAADIYRPDSLTVHAAVLLVTPYLKDAVFETPLGSDGRLVTLSLPPMPEGTNPMLMAVSPLVEQDFVVVVADARGTGYSEGEYDYYNFEGGPFDGYDMVEWIAAQPWCDGNVGALGSSAAAISCYLTALTHPPHLKTMVANMHPADFYFDQWRVGGVFRYENRIGWSTGMLSRISPVNPGDPDSPNFERKRAVYERRFHRYYERLAAGRNAANLDWLTELYQRDTYDDFWKAHSFLARSHEIDIPTLHGGVWFDHFIRGTLASHGAINVPKRLFVGPGSLITRPELADGGLTDLTIAWLDHFLRGADNSVTDGPPARLYLLGLDDYVDQPVWPVPTTDLELFLSGEPSATVDSLNDGSLAAAAPLEQAPDVITHDPAAPNPTCRDLQDQRSFERLCLTYTSRPLDADITMIGAARLFLHATTDAADVDFCVRLCDVFPDGRSRLLNTGALKGSHVFSHEQPEALIPGSEYCFEVEVWAVANLFRAGHRIRIDVSTSDFPFFESNPAPSTTRIFHDTARPSRLVLPIT